MLYIFHPKIEKIWEIQMLFKMTTFIKIFILKIFNCKNSFEFDEIIIVGNNLIINGILKKDDGDFTCEVETKETISVKISIYLNSLTHPSEKKNIVCVSRND